MDETPKDENPNELTYAERQKAYRKKQYQKAKERFKNSEYAKQMKEKQKEYRKKAYEMAKQRKRGKSKSDDQESLFDAGSVGELDKPSNKPVRNPLDEPIRKHSQTEKKDDESMQPVSMSGRPLLRLIVNPNPTSTHDVES